MREYLKKTLSRHEMRPVAELYRIKDSLYDVEPCSRFELEILHALVLLEKNGGNRTWVSQMLKISVRTLREWITIMRVWGLEVPEYDPEFCISYTKAKSKKKKPRRRRGSDKLC